MKEFDYIVVGGGTAGTVLARRLSGDPDREVLLLEAGGPDGLPESLNYLGAWDSPLDWAFRTTPQAGLGGVVVPVPRGKALGGSSAINSMFHVRAHPSSYDAWEAASATGWNAASLLPYLKRSEQAEGTDARWRGQSGPMLVAPPAPAKPGSFYSATFEAAAELGFASTPDGNGEQIEGTAHTELNIVAANRQSAADAYVRPVLDRENLTVVTGAFVRRVLLAGQRCTGVEYTVDGQSTVAHAAREVVLTAGTVGSAQLLLTSGIGPAAHLREVGVEVRHDLAGVGRNLQDHPFAHLSFAAREYLDDGAIPDQPHLVTRSSPDVDPDLQLVFTHLPLPVREPGAALEPWGSSQWALRDFNGYSVIFSVVRPASRGTLRLADAEPTSAPLIDPAYYSDASDLDRMVTALRLARELGNTRALAGWREHELRPGAAIVNDRELREYVRLATGSFFHLTGTCALGTSDEAVVDPELRVRGLSGLRVADASVMPSIVAANTNATVLAIAERAADLITTS